MIQNLTKKILEFQNFQISAAKNGEQVLQILEKEKIDAILLDINMPVMDGMECARRVRALHDQAKAGIPIIAITGNARNYSLEDFRQVGINDYIPKPLDFDRLVELLKELTADKG